MGTTTKMAIPYPEATGLVKDGWEDMKDIANQVDAKSGLVLINTTSFSAVSSQNFTSVFSASYTNYKINVDVIGSTTLQNVLFRLLSGTTPNTSGNYNIQVANFSNTTVDNERTTGGTSFRVARCVSTNRLQSWAEIYNPFATENTQVWSFMQSEIANPYWRSEAGTLSVTTSYDGFQILPASGTITGSVSVFGYNK